MNKNKLFAILVIFLCSYMFVEAAPVEAFGFSEWSSITVVEGFGFSDWLPTMSYKKKKKKNKDDFDIADWSPIKLYQEADMKFGRMADTFLAGVGCIFAVLIGAKISLMIIERLE